MANWFQDHPATSIVTYTLLVGGATWAASTFILQDNRLNLAKSELESQKTLAEQYKSKTELLQKDLEAVRAENQEYRNWLAQSKDAVPIMVPRLIELKKQVDRLSTAATPANDASPRSPQQSSTEAMQSAPPPPSGSVKPKQLPQSFTQPRTAKLGRAGLDDTTGVVVSVKQTHPDQTATLLITFPDRGQVLEERVHAGRQFKFSWGGRAIVLTVLEITFLTDTVTYRMQPTDA